MENSKSKKRMKRFKEMDLASKTAVSIGILLVFVFAIIITLTIGLTKKALLDAIDSDFSNMSEKNALKIQTPFNSATATATNLQTYLQKRYQEYASLPDLHTLKTTQEQSQVFGKNIQRFFSETEAYLLHTANAGIMNDKDIIGIGMFFEPGAFDQAIHEYSFYMTESNQENPAPFGSYADYSKEVYYQKAKETKEPFYTPPYTYDNIQIVTASYPIVYNNDVKGVVVVDLNVNNFTRIISTDNRYPTMYQDILTEDGTIVFDSTEPDGEYVGVNLSEWLKAESSKIMMEHFTNAEAFEMSDKNAQETYIQRYFYPIQAGNQVWWSLIGVDKSDKEAAITQTLLWLLSVVILSFITIIVVTVLILRRYISPIKKIVYAAESIAAGNFEVELESSSADEIGILTRAFSITVQNLKSVIYDISRVLQEIAAGNLNTQTQAEYVGDLKNIEIASSSILENLNNTVSNITTTSLQVSGGASQISYSAQSLAEGATEQASAIEELQATITDISEQVESNYKSAKEANDKAIIAGQSLQHGNQQMKEMLKAMEEISKASGKIRDVIQTIEDIASQTNLLSLNASIEAARAGDAGRGFAVVADQVGKLATESSDATKVTTELIAASLKAVEQGMQIAQETAASLDSTVYKVDEMVENVESISKATETQTSALQQITSGVEQISDVIQENSAMSEESAAAAEELSAQAQILDELMRQFKLK